MTFTSPAAAPTPDAVARAVADFMAGASLEATAPSAEEIDGLAAILKPGTEVFVSAVPRQSLDARLAACIGLTEAGLAPVPHLAARACESVAAVDAFLARARREAGVSTVLVIAGDCDRPAGPFADAMALLEKADTSSIPELAVAGHPAGHPRVGDAALDAALRAKAALFEARGQDWRIVTQFGFDPGTIAAWIARLREQGITRPVGIGMAGPASVAALMKFAVRCGVVAAGRGLARNPSAFARLVASAGPGALALPLAEAAAAGALGSVRPHFFSFGGAVRTARWLRAVQDGRFSVGPAGLLVDDR